MTRALADASALYPNFQAERKKQLARISSSALATKREKNGSAPASSIPVTKASRVAGFSDVRPVTASVSPTQRPATEQQQRASEKQPRTLAPVTARRGLVRPASSAASSLNQREDAVEHLKDVTDTHLEREPALENLRGRPTHVRAARDVSIRGDLGFSPGEASPQPLEPADWTPISRPRTSAANAAPLVDPSSLPEVSYVFS
jgi:hypothetical protein